MHLRRTFLAALSATLLLGVATPAGAASDEIDDPSGDVADADGAAVADPRYDITGVTFTSSPTEVELEIEVAQVVPFDDPAWERFDLGFGAVLDDTESDADGNAYTWVLVVFEGEASGFLLPNDGFGGCFTEVAQTATSYVLSGDAFCARGLPRSLSFGAVSYNLDGSAGDAAPDGEDLAGPVTAMPAGETNRVAGTDRILTAIELSGDLFGDAEAGAVVLAAAQSFPDALAGGPLAAGSGAPMLLTGAAGLDARVRSEIERVLEPGGTVYVLGGTAALSDQVVTDLRNAGYAPARVAGVNRFETAIAIAEEIGAGGAEHLSVLLADGTTFPDALIAGAAAATTGGIVVLTDGATMPESTRDFLANDDTEHIAIGAPASQAATGVRSITGASPSELSANVADELLAVRGVAAVASQASFADALAGGPHIAYLGGALLLTDPATLSPATQAAIEASAGSLREVVIYGGTAAVSAAVEQTITATLAP